MGSWFFFQYSAILQAVDSGSASVHYRYRTAHDVGQRLIHCRTVGGSRQLVFFSTAPSYRQWTYRQWTVGVLQYTTALHMMLGSGYFALSLLHCNGHWAVSIFQNTTDIVGQWADSLCLSINHQVALAGSVVYSEVT